MLERFILTFSLDDEDLTAEEEMIFIKDHLQSQGLDVHVMEIHEDGTATFTGRPEYDTEFTLH